MNGDLVQIESHRRAGDSMPRLVTTLALAGLLSGLAIVGAFEATRPRIAANQARALRAAVFEVVPGAAKLQRLAWRDGRLQAAAGDAGAEPSIYAGYGEDGRFLGYAITGEGAGYQDVIALLYGFDPARRRVVGMRVLESRETPGLGDRIYKDEGFVGAFRDLAVEPEIELVTGGDATAANQVDGLTGATISSRAVVRIVNDANAEWLARLFPPGSEPPLAEEEKP
ncbi:MAG TPA: FMN-binding protein [Thermoanaerobaculia bacterium]|jgi:electron transport complex protein RnfG